MPCDFSVYYNLGEIGYAVGSIYTSLSGAYNTSGTGTIQLCCTGKILEEMGFKYWDFEMSHPYKLALGAKEIPRLEWSEIYSRCKIDPPIPFQEMEEVNAKSVLTGEADIKKHFIQ